MSEEDFELIETAVELSQLGKLEPMPARLRAKVEDGAATYLGHAAPPRRSRAFELGGWLAAAACLALAAASWLRAPREITKVVTVTAPLPAAPTPLTAGELRERLRRTASDLVEVAWTPTKDAAARSATGNVVWSTGAQRGYMHFHGLAANDRAQSTYQLWIFDKERDARYPVDGGIFDIDDDSKDIIVPIDAKVHVGGPTLFAVTVEKPGGVVVSKRERIVVTAAVN
jgi:hypothetical protein